MKLSIMGFDNQIEFNDHSNTILCIKDYQMFSSILFTIYDIIYNKNETNEIVLLDDKGVNKPLKSVQLVLDPLSLDLNAKNIQKLLFAKIEQDLINDEDEYYKFQESIDTINKIIFDELGLMNMSFAFNTELTVSAYLKAVSLKISKEDISSVYDLMYNYFEIISELLPDAVLFICNCLNFLTSEQILELCKYKNYKHLKILFIEQNERHLDNFKSYIIDDDLLEYTL